VIFIVVDKNNAFLLITLPTTICFDSHPRVDSVSQRLNQNRIIFEKHYIPGFIIALLSAH
jgi:hypothetical protein